MDGAPPAESIRLKIRVFGEDAAVDARLLAALKALGLPGDALPEAPVEAGPERWAVDIARVKGDAPRETEAEITWQRTPPMLVGEKPCKKPAAIDLPAELPAWLDAVTNARSTRRRVLTGFDRTPERLALEVGMLYHNGYALDEGVGHLTALARKRGYTQASGSGSRQTWRHPDGAELSWRSDNDPLALGCSLAGPFLRVAWQDR